jgi:hypothetical protein
MHTYPHVGEHLRLGHVGEIEAVTALPPDGPCKLGAGIGVDTLVLKPLLMAIELEETVSRDCKTRGGDSGLRCLSPLALLYACWVEDA